jgi:predicted O-methyltransferase YrrM
MLPSIQSGQEVKDYFDRRFSQENALLHLIRTQSHHEGLPDIQIPIYLGKLLYLLAKIQAPHQILEIGTLGGYSTAWLAQALAPHGRLISLEINLEHAIKAREHLHALKEKNIEIRIGHAVDLLAQLAAVEKNPFDLIFIDADKENNALYLDWSLRLSRPGTLILIDNLIPKGNKVGYPANEEAKAVYAFNDYLAQHPLIETAVVPTLVGSQGRLDGLAIARVKEALA